MMRFDRATPLRSLLVVCLWVAGACTTSTGPSPSSVEKTPEGGFSVTQDIRVGVGVRSDFDAALSSIEDGDVAAGIERLVEVTEAAPRLVAAHLNLGVAYRLGDEFEQSESSLRRAIELSPRHPGAHNELGITLRRQGRFDEARESYERALSLAPQFHPARRNLAILCDLFLADASCALEHYEQYAAEVPNDDKVGIWIADLRNRSSGNGRAR